jgi:hypothetical protein
MTARYYNDTEGFCHNPTIRMAQYYLCSFPILNQTSNWRTMGSIYLDVQGASVQRELLRDGFESHADQSESMCTAPGQP